MREFEFVLFSLNQVKEKSQLGMAEQGYTSLRRGNWVVRQANLAKSGNLITG